MADEETNGTKKEEKVLTIAESAQKAGHNNYYAVAAIDDIGEVKETGDVVIGLLGHMGERLPAVACSRSLLAKLAVLSKKYPLPNAKA